MSEPPDRTDEIARWTQKAEHDFLAAEHMMDLAGQGADRYRVFPQPAVRGEVSQGTIAESGYRLSQDA